MPNHRSMSSPMYNKQARRRKLSLNYQPHTTLVAGRERFQQWCRVLVHRRNEGRNSFGCCVGAVCIRLCGAPKAAGGWVLKSGDAFEIVVNTAFYPTKEYSLSQTFAAAEGATEDWGEWPPPNPAGRARGYSWGNSKRVRGGVRVNQSSS